MFFQAKSTSDNVSNMNGASQKAVVLFIPAKICRFGESFVYSRTLARSLATNHHTKSRKEKNKAVNLKSFRNDSISSTKMAHYIWFLQSTIHPVFSL